MFVRHTVSDFATWKEGYDNAGPMQDAAGVTAEAVYQSADDPNDVTVVHDFATIEAAKTFAGSPELKQAMQGAGVVGAPIIWFTTRV
jgi:hypothetical protein